MKRHVLPIILLVTLSLSTGSINIQFNEMGLVTQNLDIYHPNGTLFISSATNSSITFPDNQSFQASLRPSRINYFRDPGQALNLLLEYWEFILILVGFAWFIRMVFSR